MAMVLKPVIVSVDGSPLVLLPGDEVPEGVRVSSPGVVSGPAPSLVMPRGNASREAWAEYAAALGVEASGLSRNQIKEAVNDVRNR